VLRTIFDRTLIAVGLITLAVFTYFSAESLISPAPFPY
jgi:hypothetical protein